MGGGKLARHPLCLPGVSLFLSKAWEPRSPGERRLQEAGRPGFRLCHLVGAHCDEARSHKGQRSCWKPSFLSLSTASPSRIVLQPRDLSVLRSHHHFLPSLKPCAELKLKLLPPPTPARFHIVQASARCSPLWWPFSRPPSPCCGLFWSSPRPEAGPHGTTGLGSPLPPVQQIPEAQTSRRLLQPCGLYLCLARSRSSQTLKAEGHRPTDAKEWSSATEVGTGWQRQGPESKFHGQRWEDPTFHQCPLSSFKEDSEGSLKL